MQKKNKKWLLALVVLLFLVGSLGLFLYSKATVLEEMLSGGLILTVFLSVVLLILLEIFLADLACRAFFRARAKLADRFSQTLGSRGRRVVSIGMYVLLVGLFVVGFVDTVDKMLGIAQKLPRCYSVLPKLAKTPYRAGLLSKCPLTRPLASIMVRDMSEFSVKANRVLSVLLKYTALFTDYFYMGIAIVLASGIPRKVWKNILVSLCALAKPEGEELLTGIAPDELLTDVAPDEMVHEYKGRWIVAVRQGRTYHALAREDIQWSTGKVLVAGSLPKVARDARLFHSRAEARAKALEFLRRCDSDPEFRRLS